jgi:hypothetical protein
MTLSILDLFLLSMLDRGAQSPYELQRTAGVSLGAPFPHCVGSPPASW